MTAEIQRARDYVAEVKSALGPLSSEYRSFLNILKLYKSRELSPTDVIVKISDLFHDDDGLIRGFDAFLPPEYRMDQRPNTDDGKGGKNDNDNEMEVTEMDEEDQHKEKVSSSTSVDATESLSRVAEGKVREVESDQKRRSRIRISLGSTKKRPAKDMDNVASSVVAQHPCYNDFGKGETSQTGLHPISSSQSLSFSPSKRRVRNIKLTTLGEEKGRRKRQLLCRRGSSSFSSVAAPAKDVAVTKKYATSSMDVTAKDEDIILSPPLINHSSDLLYNCNPIQIINRNAILQQKQQQQQQQNANDSCGGGIPVDCQLCRSKRNAIAITNTEPVLLCDQMGCNTEYHLGCLYNAGLFRTKDDNDEKRSIEEDGSSSVNDVNLAIPPGEIYCVECQASGATAVLAKYFDKVEDERSHFSSNRAYVTALLEKQMTENPNGNMNMDSKQLKNMPRSEIWFSHELHRLAMSSSDSLDAGKNSGDDNVNENSADFLVGKPVILYNTLDNEYHSGRIVDKRICTVYPPCKRKGKSCDVNGTTRIEHLQYYGVGPLSTCEFLVRFPAGLQGRKKDFLRWIMLEEHSVFIGISLIEGKISKSNNEGGSGGVWKPAMILARSALELVLIRALLNEDERGNLFSYGKNESSNDKWVLASFFGEERQSLLRLRDEARDLLHDDRMGINGVSEITKDGKVSNDTQVEDEENYLLPSFRHPLAFVDGPLALLYSEKVERERCIAWSRLILDKSNHPRALLLHDEYSVQAHSSAPKQDNGDVTRSTNCDNQLRGLDLLWLARLVEKVSSSSFEHPSIQMSKENILSFKCENVTSVVTAMASLQRQ